MKDSREIDPVTTLPDAELLNNIVDYNNLGEYKNNTIIFFYFDFEPNFGPI